MRNEKFDAAVATLQSDFHAAEIDIDTVLAQLGRLATALSKARLDTGVSARMGQQAMSHVATAMGSLIGVREQVLLAHRSCAKEGKIALPELGWGDDGGCPPVKSSADAHKLTKLRAVN